MARGANAGCTSHLWESLTKVLDRLVLGAVILISSSIPLITNTDTSYIASIHNLSTPYTEPLRTKSAKMLNKSRGTISNTVLQIDRRDTSQNLGSVLLPLEPFPQ